MIKMLTVLLSNPSNQAFSTAHKTHATQKHLRDFLPDAKAAATDGRSDNHGEALLAILRC